MLDIKICKNDKNEIYLETSLSGKPLLTTPQLNKGTAFTLEERETFGLLGKLPIQIETLEKQLERSYEQYSTYETFLKKNIYLNNLHDTNQVLYYALVRQHLDEMLPVIYTPIVGTAVKQFSREFRQTRGLYISYPEIDKIDLILSNRSNPEIDLIVVTDGEGVLGIGDQGVGGMDIPVAKLMVYSLCGGIDHLRTLPILLDVGTNNQELLNDPLYLGWKHPRVDQEDYDRFIEKFIEAIKHHFPHVFLHWEDFGARNARRNLDRFRDQICTFNDDMQGTGAVTLSALLSAIKANKAKLTEQRVVVFGAGTAGTGIADQICAAMQHEGLTDQQAHAQFWLIDRYGLLVDNQSELTTFQKPYARARDNVKNWETNERGEILLAEVVKQVKPHILIGCSAQSGVFSKPIIQMMAEHVERPIIFPLSNPTEKAEATPADLINWTNGKAIIATGSPFDSVTYEGKLMHFAQCNNALVFPGIGLGVLAAKARRLSDEMIWAACSTLSECSPILTDPAALVLPGLSKAQGVAKKIAIAVAKQAVKENLADIPKDSDIEQRVNELFWEPKYLPYRLRK